MLALLGSTTAAGLDAVVVTHDHPDHVVDLHGLLRARLYAGQELPRIALYAPEAVVDRVTGLEDGDRSQTARVFAWRPLPAAGYAAGPFRLESRRLPHYVPNAGVRLVGARAGRRLHGRHRPGSRAGRARARRRPVHRRRDRRAAATGRR